MNHLLWTLILSINLLEIQMGFTINISPKLDFIRADKSQTSFLEDSIDLFKPIKSEGLPSESAEPQKMSPYIKTIIIKRNDEQMKEEEKFNKNVDCNHKECVYELQEETADIKSNMKKVSTDVHVIISTDINKNTEVMKPDNDDIPVLKGYNGVKSEDINWNEEYEEEQKSKQKINVDKEQPSSIVTNLYSKEPIIINNQYVPQEPIDHMMPPNKPPSNWNTEPKWSSNDNSPSFSSRGYGDSRGVRLPSGWSTNWVPVNPAPQFPDDYYHYNVHGRENGFVGGNPQFETVCRCTREPVRPHGPRAKHSPRKPSKPWYPIEPTTMRVDGKLTPPFGATTKS